MSIMGPSLKKVFVSGLLTGMMMVALGASGGVMLYRSFTHGDGLGYLKYYYKKFKASTAPIGKKTEFLLDFEDSKDSVFFKSSDGGIIQVIDLPEGKGKALSFQSDRAVGFPGIVWQEYSAAECFNWRSKRSLEFDVFNSGDHQIALHVKVKNGLDRDVRSEDQVFYLRPQAWEHISLSLLSGPGAKEFNCVSYLKIFVERPPQAVNILVDNFSLN